VTLELPFDDPLPAPPPLSDDQAARLAAQTEFRAPLVLEAGAGTGKTATLVARVLAWSLGPGWDRALARLEEAGRETDHARVAGEVLGGIAAITFTDAAAAEMGMKVAAGLASVAASEVPVGLAEEVLPPPALCAERARWLIGSLDSLGVRTIHGFCQKLLSEHPLEAGVHPNFTVDAEMQLVPQAVREVLETELAAAWTGDVEPELLRLAEGGVGPFELEEALRALVQAGVPADGLDRDPLAPAIVDASLRGLRSALEGLRDGTGGALPTLSGRAPTAKAIGVALDETLAEMELLEPERLAVFFEVLTDRWSGLDKKLKDWADDKLDKSLEKGVSADLLEGIPALAKDLRAQLKHLMKVDIAKLRDLYHVLRPLCAAVHERLQAQGVLTFEKLLTGARDLLTKHTSLCEHIRRGIDQLLVDEFQDTDSVQGEIVATLGLQGAPEERPGLFVVGDPKQSIYGWRRADLGAYEDFCSQVTRAGGSLRSLDVNFRSAPAILDEVTRVVQPVMNRIPGLQPEFRALEACPQKAGTEGYTACGRAPIEHWVSWELDANGDPHPSAARAAGLEAAALTDDLSALHTSDPDFRWSDAAVLFRSSGDLDKYLSLFRERGIPYVVERDRSYFRRREVLEAGALVRTVLDPRDHLALVTFLRSVAVGVPDAAWIPLWAHDFPQHMTSLKGGSSELLPEIEKLVTGVAVETAKLVPATERVAGWDRTLMQTVRQIAELRSAWESEPVDVFVEHLRTALLFEVSESARFLGPYRLANLGRFFLQLEHDLERTGGDAGRVLRELRSLVALRPDGEEARPKEVAQDAVHVMTVHKAKGLDFRHVYVVQTHKSSGSGGGTDTRAEWSDGVWELDLHGTRTLGFGAYDDRQKQIAWAERVRLLYVACTRAKDRLVLLGDWYNRRPDTPQRAKSLAHLVAMGRPAPALEERVVELAASGESEFRAMDARWVFPALQSHARPTDTLEASGCALPSAELVRNHEQLIAARRADAALRMARPFHDTASGHGEQEDDTVGAGHDSPAVASGVGTAIHRMLETWDFKAAPAAALAAGRGELAAALAAHVPGHEQPAAAQRAERILAALESSGLLKRLIGLGPHILARELPLLLPPTRAPEGPVGYTAGVVDLVYRDPETGLPVVVDYKTDALDSEADCQARSRAYISQGETYRLGVQAALGLEAPPRFELWFLQAGLVVVPDGMSD